MTKNKLIAIIIATVVIIGPFRYAYMQIDITKPKFTLVMFLLTIFGTLSAMFFGMKNSK